MTETKPATDEEIAKLRAAIDGTELMNEAMLALIARIDAERERAEKAEEWRRLTVTVMSEHHDRAQVELAATRARAEKAEADCDAWAENYDGRGKVLNALQTVGDALASELAEARQQIAALREALQRLLHVNDGVPMTGIEATRRIEAARAALAQTEGAPEPLPAPAPDAREALEIAREALRRISDACPATCDMTVAHGMAAVADEALARIGDGDG